MNILLLCAYSARSNAYLQAIQQHPSIMTNITEVITYGPQQYHLHSIRQLTPQPLNKLFCPDLTQDINDTLSAFDKPHYYIEDKSLKNNELISTLKKLKPDIIIYSGYGGQIVPDDILSIANILHIHSGYLPDYRGSTTLYHEVIEHNGCAASAIFLEKQIDTGPILYKKSYPLPPANMDVDYLYDNLIRADLLIHTLQKLINKQLSSEQQQAHLPAYYVIHPLLKHLALFNIDAQDSHEAND